MALSLNIGNLFAGRGLSLAMPSAPPEPDQATLLENYKQTAIDQAKAAALAEGRPPTMSDYYLSAEALGESQREQMASQGISWGPQIYADVRGQTFDGFLIRKQEIEPTPDTLRYAQALAYQNTQGREPTAREMIEAMRQTNDQLDSGTLPTQDALKNIENMYDLDGDNTISPFYTAITNQTNFEGTEFSNVTFHPAGTLTKFHSEGASFSNVTFDGMSGEADARGEIDHVRMSSGTYENITFTNITGGRIEVADHAQINGMDISGQTAELTLGKHAQVSGLDATGTNLVTLNAEPGSRIANSTFNHTTIGMESTLAGCRLDGVTFDDTNLAHVDMQGAALNGVIINGMVRGMDLSGASLQNVIIEGQKITTTNQLVALGIETDEKTAFANSPEFIASAKQEAMLAQARSAVSFSLNPTNPASPSPEAPAQAVSVAADTKPLPAGGQGLFEGPSLYAFENTTATPVVAPMTASTGIPSTEQMMQQLAKLGLATSIASDPDAMNGPGLAVAITPRTQPAQGEAMSLSMSSSA